MTEFLSVTTACVMAYAIHQVFQSVRLPQKAMPAAAAPGKPIPVVQPVVKEAPAVSVSPKPAPTPAAAPSRKRGAAPVAAAGGDRSQLVRDPVSGEVIAMPTNYRFAKKWLKEALVTEGLLDRVYKPNELDEAASQRTREALDQFRNLPKYQA